MQSIKKTKFYAMIALPIFFLLIVGFAIYVYVRFPFWDTPRRIDLIQSYVTASGNIQDVTNDLNVHGIDSIRYKIRGNTLEIRYGTQTLVFDYDKFPESRDLVIKLRAIGLTFRQDKKKGVFILKWKGENVGEMYK